METATSLRKELGFSPYQHWIKISWRGKSDKSTSQAAQEIYDSLRQSNLVPGTITPPLAAAVGRKRDYFHMNVMVQSSDVIPAVAAIKSSLAQAKRHSGVIVTINVDP